MQNATVTLIGCGSSSGVPGPGNDWGLCDPSNPKNARLRTSALLCTGDDVILIDCGPDFHRQSCLYNIRKISGILLTHPHSDHIQGISELPALMKWQSGDITCFGTRTTLQIACERFSYFFKDKTMVNRMRDNTSGPKRIKFVEIEPDRPFIVGDTYIQPFNQWHYNDMYSLGFRIGDFVYSTDFSALDKKIRSHLIGGDTWVLDCLSETPTPAHNNLNKALRYINEIKPRRAILTHMDNSMDYAAITSKLPPSVELAYDGMTIEIDLPSPEPRTDSRRQLFNVKSFECQS